MPTAWLHELQSPVVYGVFAILFVLPFIDIRHPLRWLHLDLIALLVAGAWPLYVYVDGSVPLTTAAKLSVVAALGYLLIRLLVAGLRPRRGEGPLLPLVSGRMVVAAAIVLVVLRIGYAVNAQLHPYDVGFASVAGADLLASGTSPYSGELGSQVAHGDTYGPLLYLAYVPFEQLTPFEMRPIQGLPTAGVTAPVAFDLLTAVALFLLGNRLGRGGQGRVLGAALAYAWLAYPYTLFSFAHGLNDGLPAMLLTFALLAVTAPAATGALTAMATATKFFAAGLVPLLARGGGPWSVRRAALFLAAFAILTVAAFVPVLPSGGVTELYDRTLGFQQARMSPTTIWGTSSSLDRLRDVAAVAAVGLAVVVAFVPRRREIGQVLALAAAVVVAAELALAHWFPSYLLWLAPAAFPALFMSCDGRTRLEA